jgi:hypothetical protein
VLSAAGTGLAVAVANGQALVHGMVEVKATASPTAVVGSSTTAWVWFKQDGTLAVQNGTTAKPAGNCCLLGAALTNGSAVTAIETAGVVYFRSGIPWRETADVGAPGDSPDSTLRLFTKTSGGTYFWDGTEHKQLVGAKPVRHLYAQTSVQAGDTVANTTTETNFASKYSIAANSLKVGDVIEVDVRGVYSTAGLGTTLEFKLKLGSTVLAGSGTISSGTAQTNRGWHAKIKLTVISLGASGTVEAQGTLTLNTTLSAANQGDMENSAVVTVDTTATADLQVSAKWAAADAGNTITMRSLTVTKAA